MSETNKGSDFARFAEAGAARPRAFHDANHHSYRVRFFRRAILIICISLTAMVGFVLIFDPQKTLQFGLEVQRVAVHGSKIEMRQPHLAGFRNDGQPYEVTAEKVVQDSQRPKIFDLTNLSARLAASGGGSTKITAAVGQYDSGPDFLTLKGPIRVLNDGRYDMTFESADVDLKTGIVVVTSPIESRLPNGIIHAQSAIYEDASGLISFQGSVRSTFGGSPTQQEPAAPLDKGEDEINPDNGPAKEMQK